MHGQNHIRSYIVCCLHGCLVYHIHLYSYVSIVYHFICGCMNCMFMFNSVKYVFLLLCYEFLLLCLFRSLYSVSPCCSVYCLCVNVYGTVLHCSLLNCTSLYWTVMLPPGGNSISVNTQLYIISNHVTCIKNGRSALNRTIMLRFSLEIGSINVVHTERT